jgi:hypothetical protein
MAKSEVVQGGLLMGSKLGLVLVWEQDEGWAMTKDEIEGQ